MYLYVQALLYIDVALPIYIEIDRKAGFFARYGILSNYKVEVKATNQVILLKSYLMDPTQN